jgi:hypothetical protein
MCVKDFIYIYNSIMFTIARNSCWYVFINLFLLYNCDELANVMSIFKLSYLAV